MAGLTTISGESNLGGLCTIWLLPIEFAPTLSLRKTYVKIPKANFIETPFTYATAAYNGDPAESDQGVYYKHQINFDLSKFRESVRNWIIENCMNQEFCIAFLDANQELKLIGDRDYKIKILAKIKTGEKRNDHNHCAFVAQISTPYLPRNLEFDASEGDFDKTDFDGSDFD